MDLTFYMEGPASFIKLIISLRNGRICWTHVLFALADMCHRSTFQQSHVWLPWLVVGLYCATRQPHKTLMKLIKDESWFRCLFLVSVCFPKTHFLKYCLAIIWKGLWRCIQRTFWTNAYVWVSFKETTIPVPIPVRLKWWVLHSIPIMWIVAFSCVKSHHLTANSVRYTVYLHDTSDCVL